jgi:Domain of unknown function (DUF1707)
MTELAAMRVSDAERETVVAALADSYVAGRLTLEELDERAGYAYKSQTQPELAALVADLPAQRLTPQRSTGILGKPRPSLRAANARQTWLPWAITAAVCLTIWLIGALAGGAAGYFWPMWVIGPWGVALVTTFAARRTTSLRAVRPA